MPEIKQLSPSVINKIAAGEVIERPASVVKELLENAVDAGSTRIEVTVGQGGVDLVRVADDGSGIDVEQLTLAVASHATSKIRDADDLFSVGTLGFRGEALASISAVSQLTLRSRTRESDAGFQLDVNGGQAEGPSPCGCPVGTIVEIKNLFYNTPVRKKFLRTTQTEMGHCSEAFTRIALAHPGVHFTLIHNNRTLFDLPAVGSWRERIAKLFGNELAESLIWVESQEDDMSLEGYVADPSQNRANNRMQYLFLNGRHIRDRSLQHALGEAYRGLLMTGKFSITFLRLDMLPHKVDVNVHPTKLEVRFQDGGRIYSQLLSTIRSKFLSTDLTAQFSRSDSAPTSAAAPVTQESVSSDQARREFSAWANEQATASAASFSLANPPGETQQRIDFTAPREPMPASLDPNRTPSFNRDPTESAPEQPMPAGPPPPISATSSALQVHNCYLITETEEGVVVIDQHALHERIIYEQLREKVLDDIVETQKLLVPEPVNLTPSEAAAVLDSKALLAQMGIDVEPFGGDTVLVSGYPAMLANINPAELLRQVVDLLLGEGKAPERRDLLDELLHMVSCKAAIKAGDKLTPEEITALIDQREMVQDSHHCPHGRPTTLVFTREELDKRFKRI